MVGQGEIDIEASEKGSRICGSDHHFLRCSSGLSLLSSGVPIVFAGESVAFREILDFLVFLNLCCFLVVIRSRHTPDNSPCENQNQSVEMSYFLTECMERTDMPAVKGPGLISSCSF